MVFAMRLYPADRLIRCGTLAEIGGVVLLSVTLFTDHPLTMALLLPLGGLLVLAGWLAWLYAFLRSL